MKMKSMEDDMLYERRGTPALRSARSELVVPTPWTSWLWPGAPYSKLWPRACAATGNPVSMLAEPRTGFSPLSWVYERASCRAAAQFFLMVHNNSGSRSFRDNLVPRDRLCRSHSRALEARPTAAAFSSRSPTRH
jgi:hypothetical protein